MYNPTDTMRISFIEPTLITEALGPDTVVPEYRYEFLFGGCRRLDQYAPPPGQEDEAVVKVRLGSTDVYVAIKIVGVRRG